MILKKKLKRKKIRKDKTKTVVRICDLDDNTIKNTTGFTSVLSLLSFIIVICEGNIELMEKNYKGTYMV
jgi:hypothetical protein